MLWLTNLYAAFFADPMYYIGILFAALGAWGLIMFVAGLPVGMRQLITYSEAGSHVEHARVRTVNGLLIVMVAIGLWEIVRVIAGEVPLNYLWISFVMLIPLWWPWLKKLAGGGGGH